MDKPTSEANLVAALECLFFLAEEPLPEEELARMLEATPAQTQELIAELSRGYVGRGLQLIQVAGGWKLCTRPEYAPFICRMHEPTRVRLSRAALETLAIIAYRQPITRPEIEAIRGVNVDGVISTLMNYTLIEEKGRKEAPGRPMLYGTTTDFLSHFGLNSIADLPALPEGELPAELPAALQAAEEKTTEPETPEATEATEVVEEKPSSPAPLLTD
jgi:segregation and condensation protein B